MIVFAGLDCLEDLQELGVLMGYTLAAPLGGGILLVDITLIAAADIF